MFVLGIALRLSRCDGRIEQWLTTPAPKREGKVPQFDVIVPGYVLAGVAISGLIVFSMASAFLYYPDREQCFAEMVAIHADAMLAVRTNRPESGNDKTQEAIRHLERWDLVARKLEVGTYLRSFKLTEAQKKSANDLREEIEVVRDYLRDGEIEEAKAALKKIEDAYRECKTAYRGE
jgi:soluble cytochrome b562